MWHVFIMCFRVCQPPRHWQGIEVVTLSSSDIGPRVCFVDEQAVFADEFHWKRFACMLTAKTPLTMIYMVGPPYLAMLLTWHFSWTIVLLSGIWVVYVVVCLHINVLIVALAGRRAQQKSDRIQAESVVYSL